MNFRVFRFSKIYNVNAVIIDFSIFRNLEICLKSSLHETSREDETFNRYSVKKTVRYGCRGYREHAYGTHNQRTRKTSRAD